jgi:hypothetical protein
MEFVKQTCTVYKDASVSVIHLQQLVLYQSVPTLFVSDFAYLLKCNCSY